MPRRKKTSPNNATKDNTSSKTKLLDKSEEKTNISKEETSNVDDTTTLNNFTTSNIDKENIEVSTKKLPVKRVGARIHSAKCNKNQKKIGQKDSKITLKVEGYAFQDDIIGVTHVRSDGEDAFNHTLRNMILDGTLENNGFSSYVTLRDKNSGKMDDHLYGADGYPRYMFMSINVHSFGNVEEASEPVLQQCQKLHEVSTYSSTISFFIVIISLLTFSELYVTQQASDPMQNIFNYTYEPVSQSTNKTGPKLLVLSDLIRYSDAYRILKVCYGDDSYNHNLESDFGKKYPDIIKKYFSNIQEIPDRIKEDLGL